MANTRLDYDKIYDLVMQCRKSGLSDRQWCIDHDIIPSTFYYWIRKLQQSACYDVPDITSRKGNAPTVAAKNQDVVCVNIQSEIVEPVAEINSMSKEPDCHDSATTVMLQYGNVKIALTDDFKEQTLKRVLLTLQETLC